MKQYRSKHKKCLPLIYMLGLLLAGCFVPWQHVFSQDSLHWTPDMIKIAKPSSKAGWIDLKEELIVNPKTIFTQYKSAFNIGEGVDMKVFKIATDLTGNKHYRYKQFYKGVPVEGGGYVVHEKNGISVGATGKLIEKLPITASPMVTERVALERALAHLNAKEYYWQNAKREQFLKAKTKNTEATYFPKGELVFALIDAFDKTKVHNVLAYKFNIRISKPKDESRLVYVDAKSNMVVKDISLDQECSATNVQTNFNGIQQIGTYTDSFTPGFDLEDDCSPTTIKVYDINNENNIFNDHDNNWTDPYQLSAASSLWGIKRSLDIYGVYFNRSGWNGKDANIDIYQGWNFGSAEKPDFNNAEFRSDGEVHIGLSTTSSVKDDYNALDILGHEFSHGVSTSEVGWGGVGYEPGTLNEAFSDVMGEAIEYYVTGTNDWLIGANRLDAYNNPIPLRSLSNPSSFIYSDDSGQSIKNRPDTYVGNGWEYGDYDNHGVHINAGIMDYAFYLLSHGGNGWNNGQTSHAQTGSGFFYNVSGIGIEKASHIFYDALNFLGETNLQFNDMRDATIHAARDMFGGDCANEVIQLAEAWRAVGVGTQSYLYNHQVCDPVTETYYKAASTVTAGGSCSTHITGTVPVQFEARDAVILLPGFSVAAGSTFHANISACAVTAFRMVPAKKPNPQLNELKKSAPLKAEYSKPALVAFPNPASSVINLSFQLKTTDKKFTLQVFDMKMQKVKELNLTIQGTGKQIITLNLSDISSGVYLIVLKSSGEQLTTKVVLTK